MTRLILILFLMVIILGLIVIISKLLETALRSLQGAADTTKGDNVPDTFKTVAYILLILLMLGVVTGWLGGM